MSVPCSHQLVPPWVVSGISESGWAPPFCFDWETASDCVCSKSTRLSLIPTVSFSSEGSFSDVSSQSFAPFPPLSCCYSPKSYTRGDDEAGGGKGKGEWTGKGAQQRWREPTFLNNAIFGVSKLVGAQIPLIRLTGSKNEQMAAPPQASGNFFVGALAVRSPMNWCKRPGVSVSLHKIIMSDSLESANEASLLSQGKFHLRKRRKKKSRAFLPPTCFKGTLKGIFVVRKPEW